MTLSLCDQVTERVALGDPLGELSAHAATCPRCQDLVAVSTRLGAMHQEVDPGLGFSARMTVGAQHRIATRRRRRLAAGLAVSVATGAFGVFIMTRTPADDPAEHRPALALPTPDPSLKTNPPTAAEDTDLAALVELADVDHSSRLSARWAHIKKPLAPYKHLLEGETP
jgi:hypothetical protein